MSHQPERKEKDCLNCGTQVHGRFCHVCGQENIVTHQGFWPMAKHFVYDVLHFDGKFFHTLLYLFTKPGFVARQYAEGKRMSYLDPIRMYLFTSAVFFLVFFSTDTIHVNATKSGDPNARQRNNAAEQVKRKIQRHPDDTALQNKLQRLPDTTNAFAASNLNDDDSAIVFTTADEYKSVTEYDRAQATLAETKRDGWIERKFKHQKYHLSEKYGDGNEMVKAIFETFAHKLPYMLFLSLPFFAAILKLLYVRRKNFFYSDHAVFTLYHYIISFILILLMLGLAKLRDVSGLGFFGFLLGATGVGWVLYLFLEMKNFYVQGWAKTLGKFVLLNFLGALVLVVLFVLFLFFAVFQL